MTPTEAIIRELLDLGCDQARALTLINAATMQWAVAKPARSRHAEAQARYWAKKQSEMIISDQNDQTKEGPPIPPKENPSLLPPVTSLRSVTATPRGELFGRGAEWLAQVTGKPLRSVKSLIGRWLKDASDEAHRVLAALDQARDDQIAEPIAWVTASLKPDKKMKSRDTAYAALDRIDAIANTSGDTTASRLSLGAPTGKIVPFHQQRDHGGDDRFDGLGLHPISRKPIEGDLLPLDRDACQF